MSARRWRLFAWVAAIIGAAALLIGMLDGDPGYGADIPVAGAAFLVMLVCYAMEFRAKRSG